MSLLLHEVVVQRLLPQANSRRVSINLEIMQIEIANRKRAS